MRRCDLTQKQIEALDLISAAGPDGLARKGSNGRVTVNGNCVYALYGLGLIQKCFFPLRLTASGEAAQRGDEFTPARYVYFSRANGEFWQAPTYNYKAAYSKWSADVDAKMHGRPTMLESRREDEFRSMFPGVEISE